MGLLRLVDNLKKLLSSTETSITRPRTWSKKRKGKRGRLMQEKGKQIPKFPRWRKRRPVRSLKMQLWRQALGCWAPGGTGLASTPSWPGSAWPPSSSTRPSCLATPPTSCRRTSTLGPWSTGSTWSPKTFPCWSSPQHSQSGPCNMTSRWRNSQYQAKCQRKTCFCCLPINAFKPSYIFLYLVTKWSSKICFILIKEIQQF